MASKRYGVRILAFLMAACSLTMYTKVSAQEKEGEFLSEKVSDPATNDSIEGYFKYCQEHKNAVAPQTGIIVQGSEFSAAATPEVAVGQVQERRSALLNEENEWCEWSINVEQAGVYALYLTYCPLDGNEKDIQLSVAINGRTPFSQANELSLSRLWKDEENENGAAVEQDALGNDIRPKQVEVRHYVTHGLVDITGLYSEPYKFYFDVGQHTVRLSIRREAVAVNELSFTNSEALLSYEDYIAQFSEEDFAQGNTVYQQAEQASEKNSSVLYPTYDRTTVATQPNDPDAIRLNTIGQSNWSTPGMSISWTVPVSEPGLYRIAMRARQSYSQGMNSYRNLYINGKIPFFEAKNISFEYDQDWYIKTLGDENAKWVYLEAGDVLTLECTTGEMSEVLRNVQEAVLQLNTLYREILVITGSSPDIYRDYDLEGKIPTLLDELSGVKSILQDASEQVKRLIGKSGSQASKIDEVLQIINDFIEDTYEIPERFNAFKDNIEALGSLILTLSSQPLELDYIALIPKDGVPPKANASFGSDFVFGLQKFLFSFLKDYNSLGGTSQSSVTAWVSTGRDQAQLLNNMINDTFSKQTGIFVNLSMVDTGSVLIQATLAGKGPDVALMIPESTPVNLAMRGALLDLSNYDLTSLNEQFYPSAWTPYRYNGGIFALPETQTFGMLFYRTDIFEELRLTVPNTWEEFYDVLETIQSNNLQVGIPEVDSANLGVSLGIATFERFLFQNGGAYYNDALTATEFNTEIAYEAFEKWVKLYSEYGLSREFNFFNRFRSGEMPMSIQPYSVYNQLSSAAPEIRGLWSIAPIPGTVQKDGTINRSESSTGTGCMILQTAENHGVADEAFELISWWASSETQIRYGQDLEAMLGVASRYTPASVKAFEQLGWTDKEIADISAQWEWITNPPQIPGNYTVARSLTSAFRTAVDEPNNIRRYLSTYNNDINDEISRKRKEFNLD